MSILAEDKTIWRNILAIMITWGILSPLFTMEIQYEQLYLKYLGEPPLYIGLTYGLAIILLAFSRLLGGYLADNFGRKRLIFVLTYLVGLMYFIPYLIVDWVIVSITLIVMNIFFLFQPAISAIIADSSEQRIRGRIYSIMNTLSLLLTIPAPIFANYFVKKFGLINGMRIIYLIIALGFLLAGFIRHTLLVETLSYRGGLSFDKIVSSYREAAKFAIKYLKWPLVARIVLFSTGFATLNFTGLYIADYLGYGRDYWGEVFFYANLITVFVVLLLGFASDRIGREIPILTAMIYYIPTIALLLYPKNPFMGEFAAFIVAVSAIMIARGTIFSTLFAYEADLIPKELRGKATALLALISSFTSAMFQILYGALYEINPHLIYITSIALSIFGVITLTTLTIKNQQ